MNYPIPPKSDLVDILHGVRVPDPFRQLESDGDPATVAWVEAENALTRSLLDSPDRDRLAARLKELHRAPRASVPAVRGDHIFFLENDGTHNQPALYLAGLKPCATTKAGLKACATSDADVARGLPSDVARGLPSDVARGLPSDVAQGFSPASTQILVDPNALDPDGTTAITVFEPDDTGDRVVYALSRDGSDAQELRVLDIAQGTTLTDCIRWVKFASIAWWRDGFFYTRYPQPGTVPPEHEQYFCQVRFHRLGETQDRDRLVYHRPDAPSVTFDVDITADGRHLVITSHRGASDDAEVHVVRLPVARPFQVRDRGAESPAPQETVYDARPLVTGFTSGWHFIDGSDGVLYFRTDAGAPFGRIVCFDLANAEPAPAGVIPESKDTLVDALIAGGRLVVSSLRNASSRLESWRLDGTDPRELALPGIGTIVGLAGRWHDTRSFATFTSFTMPPAIMTCDADAGRLIPLRSAALPFDPADYATEQVWYPSKDGTPISMFLTRRRPRAGDHARRAGLPACPILLSGYGGFNISLTPAFDASDFLWLDAGGVMAVANLRGGGEYGDAWHRSGMRERKQNVFDDFIAGAEWLLSTGRATPGHIASEGGSNGGLLVAACMVQRPDLFGAVICRVPVADMLRYHRFTVGRFWIPEYGCADQADDFVHLQRYSPYHNVVDAVAYPPALVMTADTDDRVAPGMAKKFAARLQQAVAGLDAGPILLRVETRAGHGAGKPVTKQIEEQADIYAFLSRFLTRTSASEHVGP